MTMSIILKFCLVLLITNSLFAESQGEMRAQKNIQISIIKLRGYGVQTDYFFNSSISLGLGAEVSGHYQNQTIWGTSLNSIYYGNEIKNFKRNSIYLSTNYYPFRSLGLYIVGRLGYTRGVSIDEKDRLLFGLNGDVSPAFPKEQYGYRIEEGSRGFIGTGFGYRHVFSSGVFLGSELDFSFYPHQSYSKKYSAYVDSTTFLPNAKIDIVDYLYQRQVALENYHSSKGFGQLKILIGIAF